MDDLFVLTDDISSEETQEENFSFLECLNPQQKEAVLATEGPLLVLSGAGTGKTRVLTTRIAYLIASKRAFPWQILAVTFTNKAAKEMQERLTDMIGSQSASVWLGTFHRIGMKILKRHAECVGLNPNFVIVGTEDQERLIKKIMMDLGLDVKKYKPKTALDIISSWKDKGYFPNSIPSVLKSSFALHKMEEIYRIYQDNLMRMNAVDFGDLLLYPLDIIKKNPSVLDVYQQQFKYILVDEFQDTNTVQYLFLRLISLKYNNICCVGDDDQSIYSWRGAEVENILQFEKNFSNAKIIRLEQNYRSTPQILACASSLISHNTGRLGKNLYVAENRSSVLGENVLVSRFYNGLEEAQRTVELITQAHKKGAPLSSIAVLVRASFQTREFEDIFVRSGIPYKIIGGFKFYDREEIKDVIAYLRLISNHKDDLAFVRIVNKPKRGIGPSVLEALQESSQKENLSLFDSIDTAILKPNVLKKLTSFKNLILSTQENMQTEILRTCIQKLLEDSGYFQMWKDENTLEAEGRIENIQELLNVLDDYQDLNEFLEHVSLLTDEEENQDADKVLIMTLHASKGLEFSHVFLPGWEEGTFPHQKALDEGGEIALEEERRLAYVGLTRAQEKAYISFASTRRIYGSWQHALPSRFIDELPYKYITPYNLINKEFDSFQVSSNYSSYKNVPSKRIGKRVFHELFGNGTVLKDENGRLEVSFDKFGIKKVISKFVEEI